MANEDGQVLVSSTSDGLRYYVYGGVNGLIGYYDEAGHFVTNVYNHRGDVEKLTDENGAVTGSIVYNAYGKIVDKTGTVDTPFLFGGRYGNVTDGGGLVYMQSRYYNPDLMRFMTRDSVVGSLSDSQSLNRYTYAEGNPLIYIDPEGTARQWLTASRLLDMTHVAFQVGGFVPVFGDALDIVDAGVYLAQGDYTDALISGIDAIPAVGSEAGLGLRAGNDAAKVGHAAVKATETAKSGYIKYGELDELGRATGAEAYITKDMIGTGSSAKRSIYPSGWQTNRDFDRGHIIANVLGGSGRDPRNLTTLHHHANTPVMRDVEMNVRNTVRNGENVLYKSTPVFVGNEPIARGITIDAKGDNGYRKYVSILNRP